MNSNIWPNPDERYFILGEGKTTSLLSASFRWLRRQKLVESWDDFWFLRGECTKLGEGDT